jgi:hypothetical protein
MVREALCSSPDVITSVAIAVGPSITAPLASLLVTLTVLLAVTDDGVRALLISMTCATLLSISLVAVTMVSVFVVLFHVVDSAVAAAVDGVAHDATGLSNAQDD